MVADWYSYPYNVSGLGNFLQHSNDVLNGWFGAGIIFIIFLASFVLSLASGTKKALAVSGFISFIFSVYLVRLDLINPVLVITFVVITIIGAIGGKEEGGL